MKPSSLPMVHLLSALLTFASAHSKVIVQEEVQRNSSNEFTEEDKKESGLSEQNHINMTLCVDKCIDSRQCKSYVTPLSECYSSGYLFPDDPSWSGMDILDVLFGSETLIRTIFGSSNGTCLHDRNDDKFQIPLNECVGPFGAPRPWGVFQSVGCPDEHHKNT